MKDALTLYQMILSDFPTKKKEDLIYTLFLLNINT